LALHPGGVDGPELCGPKTVPEIARMRSVSRQYIQKLANELIGRRWLALIDNPRHRRSKMLQLTKSGERQLAVMSLGRRVKLHTAAPCARVVQALGSVGDRAVASAAWVAVR